MEISINIVKAIIALLLIFCLSVYAFFYFIDRRDAGINEPFRYIESWTVTGSDGSNALVGRTYSDVSAYTTDYTIESTLPEGIGETESLYISTRKDLTVYINGVLRKEYVEEDDFRFFVGAVKRFYLVVPLTKSDAGAPIRIVVKASQKDEEIVSENFITTRYGAFNYLMKQDSLAFFLTFVVLIFAIVAFIVSVVLRFLYKLEIDMMYGSVGIFVIAAWIISESPLFPYIMGVDRVNGLLSYLFCLQIPVSLAVYLNAVMESRYRKLMTGIMITTGINALLWPILHFCRIRYFYMDRVPVNTILVVMAVFSIGILVYDAIQKNIAGYRYTFLGFLGFLICCIIELSILLLVDPSFSSIFIVIGLGVMLVFVVIQQVDDLRKINQEKQHAIDISEAKTRFLASMSHEIRTPINAILGMNEMILRENSDKVIGEYSRSIKTSGKMLLMLVNDVLDFSRIEAGKLEINEAGFLMSEMLRDVISLFSERVDEKGLVLTTKLEGDIPDAMVSDEFKIRQILINLINNAIKYTDRGSVTLILGGSYTEKGFSLRLAVKDTGKGIRKEEQPHLFEAFSRADLTTNANIEGTGLGLAIVRSIVDSMNGTLGVESEYGVGSEFWVELPLRYEDRKPLEADFMEKDSASEAGPSHSSFTAPDARILAVDDNQSNLTIVKLFLKRTGIVPDLCNNGNRALEFCRQKQYDLILLDHMMPAPDGIRTLHMIREDAQSKNKETTVVVLTANAVAGSRQMYLQEGFADYLTKPLDSNVLEQTVKRLLPAEKVQEAKHSEDEKETKQEAFEILEFPVVGGGDPDDAKERHSTLRQRLASIEGLDYDTALRHCGGSEEMFSEILADIISESEERCTRMKQSVADKDAASYRIDAHSIKSNMATLGLSELSERARKHEFAARDGDMDFILSDHEEFISAYAGICRKLKES